MELGRKMIASHLVNCLFLILLQGTSHTLSERCSSLRPSKGRAWLETMRPLTPGLVRAINITLCGTSPVLVQLWSGEAGDWTVVWQKGVRGTAASGNPTVINLSTAEQVEITGSYRLGLWTVEGGDIPVAAVFDADMIQTVTSETTGPFSTKQQYTFSDLLRPYTFLLNFCTETDCPAEDGSIPTPPRERSATAVDCGSVSQFTSNSRVMMDTVTALPAGKLRAFTYNSCSESAFSVQIWRLEEEDYQLIWQKDMTSQDQRHTDGDTNIVSLHAEEMIELQAGDRFALHTTAAELPVPHTFGAGSVISSTDTTPGELCSSLAFDGLEYPLEFFIKLCNVTGCGLLGVTHSSNKADICPEHKPELEPTVTTEEAGTEGGSQVPPRPASGGSQEQTLNSSTRLMATSSVLLGLIVLLTHTNIY